MIDWKQIQQLEEDVGAEDLEEVVGIFLEEVDEAVDALNDQNPALDSMAEPMHFLKGSAYNLGFKAFGDLCSEAEQMANNGQAGNIELQKIIATYKASRELFMAEAPTHCAFGS